MAVLFLTGPMELSEAQKYLEGQIVKKLDEKGSVPDLERLRAIVIKEMQWIADQKLANLYILLAAWAKFLLENQLAWWCEIPKTPVVGWLLGIRQAIEESDNVLETFDLDESVTLIVSELGEKMLLALVLRQPSQIETPDRYVPIRWNCFWPQTKEAEPNEGQMETILYKTICSVFRYDGLAKLEKLEHDTCVRRRNQALTQEEIQESFLSQGLISDGERRNHFFLLYLLWQEANMPELPSIADKSAMDELLKFSGVQEYIEDLTLANWISRTGQYNGDPFSFFMAHSLLSKISYRFPPGKTFHAMNCGGIDRRNLLSRGLSEDDFRWIDGIHRLFAPQYLRGICEIQLRIDYYRRQYPLDWRRIMDNEKPETVSLTLSTALENLASSSVTLEEYCVRMASGQIANYAELSFSLGDRKFEQLYPEHPLAERNRLIRIGAADHIRDIAATRLSPFPEMVLDKLHILLFDCSGAVRHSLATALYHAGNHSSVAVLKKLMQEEPNSQIVRETAEVAALRCWQREGGDKYVPMEKPALALVSSNLQLAIEMNRLAQKVEYQLIFPEPQTPDLFVFPAVVRVVNRRDLGMEGWNTYIHFLQELARPFSEEELNNLCLEQTEREELTKDEVPLILIDGFLPEEEAAWGTLPCSIGPVYRAEEWMTDWIVEKVRNCIPNEMGIEGKR